MPSCLGAQEDTTFRQVATDRNIADRPAKSLTSCSDHACLHIAQQSAHGCQRERLAKAAEDTTTNMPIAAYIAGLGDGTRMDAT